MGDISRGVPSAVATSAALAFGAGGALGLLHLGGLWLTLCALPSVRAPGLLLATSFLARTLAAVLAIGIVTRGEPVPLAAAMLGLVLSRRIVSGRVLDEAHSGQEGKGGRCS